MSKTKQLTPEEIVKIIDPDNTFLNECQKAIEWRFGKELIMQEKTK